MTEPILKPLRLLAKDLEDLSILVAHLQDSLMPLTTMLYDRATETFTVLANRHCWEHPPELYEGQDLYHRVHSGVCFRGVKRVYHRGFQHNGPLRTLNFLTAQMDSQQNTLHMFFSGIHEIRLHVDTVHCHLGDLCHPWPTRKKPMHIYEHLETIQTFP